ncbi:di-trans,poly-cis-decaprenylcistransferase [Cyphellophora europaea CBS 101466]|uniref:Alkyl transferase n=1 Tax=Cyphellophora europaea (strain CBS 101466) TaxID=1220924 RepID=W2RMN3_CYPE1|nr:di-trans,poly-cis-decaprenylcistransferase [Cyphellophora europaea CBS 101466]ETN37737.1 di-trans,poly-cis-decaprenylcistransferase [Cyphellophora europaea CBS 101466]
MTSNSTSRLRSWLLASPPAEWMLNQLRELLIGALRQGAIPKHVAFVMDGNRRFAKNHRMETVEGHNLGFEALARILEVCYKAGVTHVTIYAFSIENFKRSKYEVDGLMDMAKVKLKQLVQHGDLLDRYGAKIRILGQRELIKPDVLEAVDRAVSMTSRNGDCVLNVCFPYTSREEITNAVRTTVDDWCTPVASRTGDAERKSPFKEERIANTIRSHALESHSAQADADEKKPHTSAPAPIDAHTPGSPTSSTTSLSSHDTSAHTEDQDTASSVMSSTTLHSPSNQQKTVDPAALPSPELITPETLTNHMYTAGDPPIDLLVRTSGVSRLSDFMLWQCHENTQIVFLEVLWPDFDLWSFLPVLWGWQWRIRKQKEAEMEEAQRTLQQEKITARGVKFA